MKAVIQKLTETYGPSGFEGRIRDVIRGMLPQMESSVDALGNLIVHTGTRRRADHASWLPRTWMRSG